MVDRPLGSCHPNHPEIIYSVNYGYVPSTISGDGEELDAYILGVDKPITSFFGTCIAVIKRVLDDDDKIVVAPAGASFSDNEIRRLTAFQERYFDSTIIR
jgi:inorganic pyrophosphatase